MSEERPQRFFVTISASDPERLRDVGRFGLDLFAHRHGERAPELGGLVELEDIARLVEAGYVVTVHETDKPRIEHEFASFDTWRETQIEELERRERRPEQGR